MPPSQSPAPRGGGVWERGSTPHFQGTFTSACPSSRLLHCSLGLTISISPSYPASDACPPFWPFPNPRRRWGGHGHTTGGLPPATASCAAHRGAAAGPAAAALARVQAQRWSRAACYFSPATGLFLESAEIRPVPPPPASPKSLLELRPCGAAAAPAPTAPLLGDQSPVSPTLLTPGVPCKAPVTAALRRGGGGMCVWGGAEV